MGNTPTSDPPMSLPRSDFPVEVFPLAKHEKLCPWSVLGSLAFVSCLRLFSFLYICWYVLLTPYQSTFNLCRHLYNPLTQYTAKVNIDGQATVLDRHFSCVSRYTTPQFFVDQTLGMTSYVLKESLEKKLNSISSGVVS
ncbi:hypothetical protein PAXRUDRAFT_448294 [Paxillus rubicundulus Ve08.2h10]|uniref:Uncharacterized protein n=1 Tax=Paxillus rubicundulus Ve08.2h10 TaxID=930991 RepID=A0A0D0CY32_9AGAM|nr:hypothetical protein PAXRUDRAFT_448294 [Paxillus rubicundulus Ve08.2h10]